MSTFPGSDDDSREAQQHSATPGEPGTSENAGVNHAPSSLGERFSAQPTSGQQFSGQAEPTAPLPQRSGPAGPHHAMTAAEQSDSSGVAPAPTSVGPSGGSGLAPWAASAPGHSSPQSVPNNGAHPERKSTRKTFAIATSAALLAAALSSAATFGIVAATGGGSINTGTTTVVNADPKDFADAGTVNWSAAAAAVSPSVVSITVGSNGEASGQGSGVILDTDGNIVTNNHVVSGASQVQVTLNDNKSYKAKIVGTDPSTDLAVIKISGVKDLKPVKMADATKLVVGQPVMAVGNPLGLSGTVTTGVVSALNRPVTTSEAESAKANAQVVTNAIQTSAAINPGNSGGALVNGSGELIGINSSIASLSDGSGSQSGNIGIGFAIPTNVVQNIAGQLIKNGNHKAQHALLGLAATTSQVESDGAILSSARVASLSSGGAAEKAGLKAGDHIVAIDGVPVTSSNALVGQVRARKPGTTVKLTYIRANQSKQVDVTLGSMESN